MSSLAVNTITDEAGTGSPSFPNGLAGGIPAGTVMLFVQTTAPVGFTKSTANDNKALRVVSGTASTGGTVAFTTAFASKAVSGTIANQTATNQAATQGGTVNNHTLSIAQIPSHNHFSGYGSNAGQAGRFGTQFGVSGRQEDAYGDFNQSSAPFTSSRGGSSAHNHSYSGASHNHTQNAHNHTFTGTAIDLAVQYVDVIICTKD